MSRSTHRAAPWLLLSTLVSLLAPHARAEEAPPLASSGPFRPRLSLLDVPFNLSAGTQSMQQTLDAEGVVMGGGSWAIDLLSERLERDHRPWVRYVVEVPAQVAWTYLASEILPGGGAWGHEEWHRAVLSRYGVSSFNGIYEFKAFSPTISVKHVSDEGLALIKDQHPQDFVRLSAAGLEFQIADSVQLQRDIFYDRLDPVRDFARLWYDKISVSLYMSVCATTSSAQQRELDAQEVTISERDFTGLDCSAWIYDLENDRQPYAARGTHPSGIGIDRYRYVDQLSPDGQRYLKSASWLSLLNFVSPQLFLVRSLPGLPDEGRWNFALAHQLTSFGQVVDGQLLASFHGWDVGLTYHHYLNHERAFPGLELLLVRWPLPTRVLAAHLSASALLWLQPEDGRFRDTQAKLGGGGRLELSVNILSRLAVFAAVDAKSAGWVSGNVYLDPAVQARLGLEASL